MRPWTKEEVIPSVDLVLQYHIIELQYLIIELQYLIRNV